MKTTKKTPGENRLVVTLSDDLKRRFKVACASEEIDMTTAIREMIEKWIEKNTRK